MRTLLFLAAIATQAGTPTEVAREAESRRVTSTYVPERVYDTRAKDFSDFEVMLADLSRADVVLVGEQHDDPNTHRLERAILEGLLRRKIAVRLSLEMCERDTQALLDRYLASKVSE